MGDESNGVCVYTIGQLSHVFPNLTGNTFKKKSEQSNVKAATVIFQSNVSGLDGRNLDKFRRQMVEKINTANKSWLLNPKAKLVDEVFIAPQKLRDGKENTEKFFRVKRKSNGEFDTDSIPTGGWK